MKKTIRICALILALLMLIPLVASCRKKKTDEDTDGTVSTVAPAETDQYGQLVLKSKIPDELDYGGRKVTIVIPEARTYQYEWYTDPEDESYGTLNQAIRDRELWVEEFLGVNIEYDIQKAGTSCKLVNAYITKVHDAGLGGIDIINNQRAFAATPTLIQYYANLRNEQFTYLNLDDPCWSKNFNKNAMVFDRQYYCCGDANLTYYDRAMVVFFNQTMLAVELGADKADQLYDKVNKGEWYIEDMYNMVKDFHKEGDATNGKSEGDIFGCIGLANVEAMDTFVTSLNCKATEEYDGGRHRVVTGSGVAQLEARMAEIMKFWSSTGTYLTVGTENNTQMFTNGQAMFMVDVIRHTDADMTAKVGMSDGFGILPAPKYDENQTEYYTESGDTHNVMSVMKSGATDYYEMVSAVLQAISEESYRNVRSYYIESVMRYQRLDEKSSSVMDLIFDSMSISFSDCYRRSVDSVESRLVRATMRAALGHGTDEDPTTLTGAIATYSEQCNKAMETLDDYLIYNP